MISQVGSRRQNSDGFTLIEVLIVLTLITILSTMAMPSFKGFASSSRLKTGAKAIRDLINFARDISITERTSHFVIFDLDQNQFWLADTETFNPQGETAIAIETETSETTTTQNTVSRTSMILMIKQDLPETVSISQVSVRRNTGTTQAETGIEYIYFSPNGSAEETSLTLQNPNGKQIEISVELATGRVKINESRSTDRS